MSDPLTVAIDFALHGDETVIGFLASPDAPLTYYRVPAGQDVFEVLNRACARIFPDKTPPSHDKVFERLMEQRRLDRAAKATFGA